VDGASGRARGHRCVMVELGDEMTAPDKDPRWPVMRSAPAVEVPDNAQSFACSTATCGGRREVSGGDRSTR
jgi:hypothetical protein